MIRFRGILLNQERRCPTCGSDTMRMKPPLLFTPVKLLLGERFTYRWCRHCLRTWAAIHPNRTRPSRPRVTRKQPVDDSSVEAPRRMRSGSVTVREPVEARPDAYLQSVPGEWRRGRDPESGS